MSQNYTDDCFKGTHAAQTDMQNIENNFACLKSGFSGSSAPSNPVPGMPWFDINVDQQYVRNKDNDQWLSIDFIPGTIVVFGQASAPLGWTKVTTWADNSMLCVNSQADGTALGAGGSANPQSVHLHAGGAHTHLTGAHSHQWYDFIGVAAGQGGKSYDVSGNLQTMTDAWIHPASGRVVSGRYENGITIDCYTSIAGSAVATGAATGNVSNNTAPLYHEVIACSKD